MASAERRLAADWARRTAEARALLARVEAVRARLARLEGEGSATPELRRRLDELGLDLTPPDVGALKDAAAKARREAIAARQKALDETLRSMSGYVARVVTLEARLDADEAAVTRAEAAARSQTRPVDSAEADAAARRARPRVKLRLPVTLVHGDVRLEGHSVDVSEGGLYVSAPQALPAGTEIDLEAVISGERIRARGVIRWVRKPNEATLDGMTGMGIQFKELDPAIGARLARLVAANEPAV